MDLPVAWWVFWLVAAFVLYAGFLWALLREPRRPPDGGQPSATPRR